MKHALRGASTRGLFSVILLIALLVSGCTPHYKVRAFGDAVDQSDRTITVPEGGGLTGVIKGRRGTDGWQITVYRGPDVTQGKRWSRWTRFDRCAHIYHSLCPVPEVESDLGQVHLQLRSHLCLRYFCRRQRDGLGSPEGHGARLRGEHCGYTPGGAQHSTEVATRPARPPTLADGATYPFASRASTSASRFCARRSCHASRSRRALFSGGVASSSDS